MRHAQHHVEQFLAAHDQPVLMRIEMRGPNAHRQRALDLGAQFDLDFLRVDVLVAVPIVMEVSVFIHQARYLVRQARRDPSGNRRARWSM